MIPKAQYSSQTFQVPIIVASVSESAKEKEGPQEAKKPHLLLDFTLADAKEQLVIIETQLKDRLYTEYLSQCSDIAPYLNARGRSVGSKLLEALLVSSDPPAYGAISSEEDSSGGDDGMLAGVDPFLNPVLDPFVAGLSEPFQEQYSKLQRNVILTMVGSSILCGVAGFFLGKHFGGRRD